MFIEFKAQQLIQMLGMFYSYIRLRVQSIYCDKFNIMITKVELERNRKREILGEKMTLKSTGDLKFDSIWLY